MKRTTAIATLALVALVGCSSTSRGTTAAPSTTAAPAPATSTSTVAPATPATPIDVAVACWRGTESSMGTCLGAWVAVANLTPATERATGDLDGCTSAHGATVTMTRNPFPMAACANETAAAIAAVEAAR